MDERLLMGRKESNQTIKQQDHGRFHEAKRLITVVRSGLAIFWGK